MKDPGVLVVNGDREILSVIERMFGHFRVKVDSAMSATEALKCLRTRSYRTMVTDLDMPDMDGMELARRARELNPALNIVLFVSNTSEQVLNLALDPKVTDISEVHLKPCRLGDMLMGIMKQGPGKTFLLE
jgi:CheY-like chemotaxis protein